MTTVHAVARLSRDIAAQTQHILGASSDGVARRTVLALAEVSAANSSAAAEAADAADAAEEIEHAMAGIATAASDLDRISGGLRDASQRFQI